MPRSSESIGMIATALEQIELTNPEKSLVGTIGSPIREAQRTSAIRRYPVVSISFLKASAGTRLRRCSPQLSTRRLDFTTLLAHSSGEWLSYWLVCPITEMAAPQRMGAALTYARRYALFALVGVTGEDDLGAPDLLSRAEPGRSRQAQPFRSGMAGARKSKQLGSSRPVRIQRPNAQRLSHRLYPVRSASFFSSKCRHSTHPTPR
jgi:hypothetical protein